MKFELKNIKHSDFASHETYCYEATLYIDGKRVAKVSNDGNGGCDMQWPLVDDGHQIMRAANDWLVDNGNPLQMTAGEMLPEDLEMRCHDLLTKWLQRKELKKVLKRICYAKRGDYGNVYQLPAKFKPSPEMLAMARKASWFTDDVVILNEMPEEQAIHYLQ